MDDDSGDTRPANSADGEEAEEEEEGRVCNGGISDGRHRPLHRHFHSTSSRRSWDDDDASTEEEEEERGSRKPWRRCVIQAESAYYD